MKKKSLFLILPLFLLTSCIEESYEGLRVGCTRSLNGTSIKCNYHSDNGSAIYKIAVKKVPVIKAEIKTVSGEINFSISPKGQESIFARSVTEDASFNIELPDLGEYKIVVNTNNHSGSYVFDWSK